MGHLCMSGQDDLGVWEPVRMRDFLRGAGWVFLVFVDLWWLFWAVLNTVGVLNQGDGEFGGIYVPGLALLIAFTAGLIWINVRVGRRVARRVRRPSASDPPL
jgi:hypothetical protein